MQEQGSQAKPPKLFHSNLRRTALRMATRFELSRVELQVLQNLIEWISFKQETFNPAQERSESISVYMENLDIHHKATISRAFTRLEEINLVKNRRVGNEVHRSLSTYFIDQCSHYGVDQPVNRHNAGCSPDQPSIDPLVNRQLIPGSTLSLDRRKDGGIDERMDGIKSPTTEVKFDFVTYAQKVESLFRPSAKFVPYGEINVLVLELLNEGGTEELNLFYDYLRLGMSRIRNRGLNLPVLTVKDLRGLMNGWRESEERKQWQASLKPQDAPSFDDFDSQAMTH